MCNSTGGEMPFHTLSVFIITTVLVVLSPGGAAIAIASQGATNGSRRALVGALGIAAANATYFFLSAAGIASLLLASDIAFAAVKWAGIAYLSWLGLQAIFSSAGAISVQVAGPRSSLVRLFAQGYAVEIANPKAVIYFSAILPQFLDHRSAIYPQLIVMGAITFVIDLCGYGGYAAFGSYIARGKLQPGIVKALNKCAGAALLFIACRMVNLKARTAL